MRNISILIFIISLSGCNNQPTSKDISDFERYTKDIPLLDLPYTTSCELCCKTIDQNISSMLTQKYNENHLKVVGKLTVNEGHLAVLYAGDADFLVPVIIVYDLNGNKISEKQFLGSTNCGQIMDSYGNSYLQIDSQLQITERGTSYLFKMDTVNYKIIDTLKKEFIISQFKIDKSGKIVKI